MGNWNEVEFNGPYEGEEIKEIKSYKNCSFDGIYSLIARKIYEIQTE